MKEKKMNKQKQEQIQNTKLEQIKEALDSNPEIKVVKVIEHNYLPYADGYWSQTAEFYVAPIDGMFKGEQLEDFNIIELSHFEYALKKIQPSLTPKLLAKYDEISEELSNQKIRAAAPFKEPGLFT